MSKKDAAPLKPREPCGMEAKAGEVLTEKNVLQLWDMQFCI